VKIIQYGADAMGFQPAGDLPEGIIIPPPVSGNCTDDCGDYDYEGDRASSKAAEESSSADQERFQAGWLFIFCSITVAVTVN
jgi:hypothetical protein